MTQIEVVIHDMLDDKIKEIKSDNTILDLIFEGQPIERINQLKQFINNNDIRTVYHYPRDAAELPCYAIILDNANESEQVIGMSGDVYDEQYISNMEDGWVSSDSDKLKSWTIDTSTYSSWAPTTLYSSGAKLLPTIPNGCFYENITSGTSGANEPEWGNIYGRATPDGTCFWVCKPIFFGGPVIPGTSDVIQFYSALEVKDGHRSCHMVGKKTTSLNKGIWLDMEHSVLEGGYTSLVGFANLTFWVKSNRIGTFLKFGFGQNEHEEQLFDVPITTRGLWEKVRIAIPVPDRQRNKVRFMSFRITNADEMTDIYIDALRGEKSAQYVYDEAFFDSRYRIEVWSNNAELTMMLYEIAKWNILKYRTYLETSWGFLRQRIDGGDIMPMPEYYPEFVYIRQLGYNCTTIELVPREEKTALDVKLGRVDWGS